ARIKAVLNARKWTDSVSASVPSTSKISALSMLCLPVVIFVVILFMGGAYVRAGITEHPAGQNVLRGNRLQCFVTDAVGILHEPGGVTQARPFKGVTHTAGIGKVGLLHAFDNIVGKGLLRLLIEAVLHAIEHNAGDLFQLVGCIIRKINMMGNT